MWVSTPSSCAARDSKSSSLQWLRSHLVAVAADVTATDRRGYSALSVASFKGHAPVVLDAGPGTTSFSWTAALFLDMFCAPPPPPPSATRADTGRIGAGNWPQSDWTLAAVLAACALAGALAAGAIHCQGRRRDTRGKQSGDSPDIILRG